MADVPKNIQRFNIIALVILTTLYETFPTGLHVDAMKESYRGLPKDASFEESFEFAAVAFDVVEWLGVEGFVRFERPNESDRTFYNARLTMKGLVILGFVPAALQGPKDTLASKARKLLDRGLESASAETAKTLVQQVFTLALSPGSTLAGAAAAEAMVGA